MEISIESMSFGGKLIKIYFLQLVYFIGIQLVTNVNFNKEKGFYVLLVLPVSVHIVVARESNIDAQWMAYIQSLLELKTSPVS